MPAILTAAGLQIQTVDEVFAEIVARARTAFGANVNVALQSVFGNLLRILAEFEAAEQETLLAVYQSMDARLADGDALVRLAAYAGTLPRAASRSVITAAQFNGTPATAITNGRRVRLNQTQSVWEVIGGPYVIGGGGTVVGSVQAQLVGPIAAAATGTSGWTILDALAGWSSFQSNADAVEGELTESSKSLRQRREAEIFRLADGPLDAIYAAVSAVAGVTSVNVYHNQGLATDVDGIPGKAINVVVDGVSYSDQAVRDAIFSRAPAGAQLYGSVNGTSLDREGKLQPVGFDRVSQIPIFVLATLTTSTSEDAYPLEGDAAIAEAVLEYGVDNHPVGRDILPYKFIGAIQASGVPGIDVATVGTNTDGSVVYSTAKRAMGIRERAVFDSTRITVVRI